MAPPGTLGGGSVSNRARTPVNPPNLNLQVQVNVNGTNQPLTAGQCAYISAVPNPQMPQITATIANQNNVPVSSGTATWTLNSTFLYTTKRTALGTGTVSHRTEQRAAELNADDGDLDRRFILAVNLWRQRRNRLDLHCTGGGRGRQSVPFPDLWSELPTSTTSVVTALSVPSPMNQQYWFAPNIAIHETNLSQFWQLHR